MNIAETILEPYFLLVEAGTPPSFESIMKRHNILIDKDPGCYEWACLTSLLVTLYPVEYENAINAKFKKMGFKFRVADMNV